MTTNDGGPAFPRMSFKRVAADDLSQTTGASEGGISVRDAFALVAMLGVGASKTCGTVQEIADHAYVIADAMLAAREGRKS